MLVHNILQSKANNAIFTVKPGTLVSEAAKLLADNRIGSVVVSPDGKDAQGILSERDIVREIAQRGVSCMSEKVDDYMTSKLVTCDKSDSAESVLTKMTDGHFRHMPVIDDGNMIGIITLGDVVKARLSQLAMEKNALEGMIMGH